MGAAMFKPRAILEDFSFKSLGFSREHKTSDWDYTGDKNFDYWFSKDRFTYISRGNYPQFTTGWIWGRYEDEDYYDEYQI